MIDLRSDTVTMPSKEMKQFMFNAPLGDDVYGDDPSINALEEKASDVFGKESCLFVPSGTMANLVSVLTHCNRGDEIILGNKSHIFIYEAGGVSVFGGVHSHQLKNNEDGTINLEDMKNSIRNPKDSHHPKSKLICLENTHNICYGVPIEKNYFDDVKKIVEQNNLQLHIDGARIFNAAIALNTTVKELAKNADSITCCLSKGLSCPAGSLILGSKNFIDKARYIRKSLGGGMRQSGILASAGIYSLDNMIDRLEEDHNNAKLLALELSKIDEIKIDVKKVYTNIIFFNLHNTIIQDSDLISKLLNNNIKIDSKGNRKFRMVTHYGFEKEGISTVVNQLKSILKK
tara:strand:+ start:452 stop:1486 length:1035 start_codon:yes stop_codon:yes gene_type:complete